MKARIAILTTILLWVMAIVGLGYWRLFYAWHLGSGSVLVFFSQDVPRLTLILIVIVLIEYFYLSPSE